MAKLTIGEIAELSPGIRQAVMWFNERGYETTDSGDGSNFEAGMECALEYPHVVIHGSNNFYAGSLVDQVHVLFNRLRRVNAVPGLHVELSYSPSNRVGLIFVDDRDRTGAFEKLQVSP